MSALQLDDHATVGSLEAEGAAALRPAGIENPRHEARLLLNHATGQAIETLLAYPERRVSAAMVAIFHASVRRRTNKEPIAYITGTREFWSLPFAVGPAVLIPRPDSETLIEAALAGIADRGAALRVADFGTGSGCLLLALLSELPRATGLGIDISGAALALARANAEALGLGARAAFAECDWEKFDDKGFDIVLANPPYIPEAGIAALDADVRDHEPRLALSGGPDGLAAYRAVMRALACVLEPHGRAFVELGAGQESAVAALARAAGLAISAVARDLSGHVRCLVLSWDGGKKQLE